VCSFVFSFLFSINGLLTRKKGKKGEKKKKNQNKGLTAPQITLIGQNGPSVPVIIVYFMIVFFSNKREKKLRLSVIHTSYHPSRVIDVFHVIRSYTSNLYDTLFPV